MEAKRGGGEIAEEDAGEILDDGGGFRSCTFGCTRLNVRRHGYDQFEFSETEGGLPFP